jgi:hypothetical protein
MPLQPGGQDLSPNRDPSGQASDQLGGLTADGDESRDWSSALGDHDPLAVDSIEDRKALLFELRRGDRLHAVIVPLVSGDDQSSQMDTTQPCGRH